MYNKCTEKSLRIGIALLIVFSISNGVHASSQPVSAYVDVLDFVNKNELQFYWDATYNVGMITNGDVVLSFSPGKSAVLINFTTVQKLDPVIRTREGLKFTRAFADFVKKTFSQTRVVPAPDAQEKRVENAVIPPPSLIARNKATFNAISVVVIDPGHGGKDPGAIGSFSHQGKSYRVLEKTTVLKVALKVKKLLQKEFPKLKIVMTRDTDTFISLEKRTIIANKHLAALKAEEAILFVSIHANAFWKQESNGYEVWYLPPEHRRNLVERDSVGNKNIYSILNSIREEEVTLENVQLAKTIINGMAAAIGSKSRNRGVKQELFSVVRNAKMPAVLIELGFITNPQEGSLLSTDGYQNTLSKGIVQGIKNYMELFDVSKIK